MNNNKKIFQQLFQSIEFAKLILMLLSSGIGLVLIHFASYQIKWYESITFILWLILFFLGSEFLNIVLNQNNTEFFQPLETDTINLSRLITILFFSLSIVPLARIIIFSVNNYVVIYLVCTLGFWF